MYFAFSFRYAPIFAIGSLQTRIHIERKRTHKRNRTIGWKKRRKKTWKRIAKGDIPLLFSVVTGEHPAAMQHGGQLRLGNPPFVILLASLLAFLNHRHWNDNIEASSSMEADLYGSRFVATKKGLRSLHSRMLVKWIDRITDPLHLSASVFLFSSVLSLNLEYPWYFSFATVNQENRTVKSLPAKERKRERERGTKRQNDDKCAQRSVRRGVWATKLDDTSSFQTEENSLEGKHRETKVPWHSWYHGNRHQ